MIRGWRLLAIGVVAIAAATLDAQNVFRSGVDGVTVVVSVRQGNKPVGGLTASDFELQDNGVVQQITSVVAGKVPLDLTLLLDSSSSVDGPELQRLKDAVSDTGDLLRGDDRLRLVAISQVLREVFGFQSPAGARLLGALNGEGATSLYDGMAATMMRPAEPGRRQLIVAFTDGHDSTSIIDEKAALEIARRSDSVVSVVVPVASAGDVSVSRRLAQRNTVDSLAGAENVTIGGRGPAATGPDGIPRVLTDLVAPTGGLVITLPPTGSISRVFRTMLEDFRASYVLQYVAAGVSPDGWHDIGVTLKRRGDYEIRARKGYMGRGKIGPSEASVDQPHRRPRFVWTRPVPAAGDVQVHDRPGRSGRGRPRQER